MRRRAILPLVSLLLLVFAHAAAAPSLRASNGIDYQFIAGSGTGSEASELQLYTFSFDPSSGLSLQSYPEPLLVQVASGRFGLRVDDEAAAFANAGPNDGIRAYASSDMILGPDGEPCLVRCPIPAGEDNAVVLEAGSVVQHLGESTYLWCNLDAETAELQIAVQMSLDAEFSWASDADLVAVGPALLSAASARANGETGCEDGLIGAPRGVPAA